MGPFYCPNDQTIYFDPSFFHDILQQQLNGPSGAFVEPYVIAHEFGHHIQNLLGTMGKVKTQQGPNSDSVRLELQADCYAGMWARNATQTEDSQGNVLIQDLSDQDIQEAIAAAKSVGDDTIQKETTGVVNPEQWTHGSSAARVQWFHDRLPARHARRLQHLQRTPTSSNSGPSGQIGTAASGVDFWGASTTVHPGNDRGRPTTVLSDIEIANAATLRPDHGRGPARRSGSRNGIWCRTATTRPRST